jgi:hypothetical protein
LLVVEAGGPHWRTRRLEFAGRPLNTPPVQPMAEMFIMMNSKFLHESPMGDVSD